MKTAKTMIDQPANSFGGIENKMVMKIIQPSEMVLNHVNNFLKCPLILAALCRLAISLFQLTLLQ